MTTEAQRVAERLLDAQVDHLLAELTGPAAAELVAAEALALLDALEDVTLDELVDRDDLKVTVGSLLDAAGPSPAIGAMVATLAPVLRELPASDEHRLGELVDRASVEAIVDLLVRSRPLREEVLRRLGQSPAVSILAMRFVSALVGDAVQQNRQRVEKVPGAKSLLGMGDVAARRARGMAPKHLERMVGGAADMGTQAAMERVSRALLETFDEDAVRTAAIEVWDLHAEEHVAGLRSYMTHEEVEQVAAIGHEIWLGLHTAPWLRAVVEAAIDGFLDLYGQHTLVDVLGEFGLTPAHVATEAARHAPRIVEALHRTGHLEGALRRRLEPFFQSGVALAIITEAG